MTLGALVAAGAYFELLKSALNKLPVADEFEIVMDRPVRSGIASVDIDVKLVHHHHDHHHHGHHHRNLSDVLEIIHKASYSPAIEQNACDVFHTLAEAEAMVHGTSIDEIHFHEVGAVDAIVDIVGTCICLDLLGIENIVASPVPTFHGFVNCAHGKLPLPAPAVAELLKGIPWRTLDIEGELVTPTGAAILKTLAKSFGTMPAMTCTSLGYGCGKKDFGIPNLLRAFIGECQESIGYSDAVTVIETNIDDMNPQLYDEVINQILEAGALDAYLTNVQMKKGRPAMQLTVLCKPLDTDKICDVVLKQTTSIGVRIHQESRICLERRTELIGTAFGPINVKISHKNTSIYNIKPEYSECLAAARASSTPVKVVLETAIAAANATLRDRKDG